MLVVPVKHACKGIRHQKTGAFLTCSNAGSTGLLVLHQYDTVHSSSLEDVKSLVRRCVDTGKLRLARTVVMHIHPMHDEVGVCRLPHLKGMPGDLSHRQAEMLSCQHLSMCPFDLHLEGYLTFQPTWHT